MTSRRARLVGRNAGRYASSACPARGVTEDYRSMNSILVGYGTLLFRESLGHSIGSGAAGTKDVQPIVVHGYRRLFNLRPDHYLPLTSNRLGVPGIENAAANVEAAEGHYFNGLAIPVTRDELVQLDLRERYYERRTVEGLDFESGTSVGECHVYVGVAQEYLVDDPQRLMPLWRDIVMARRGASAISEDFRRTFDSTTFVADGVQRLIDVYGDLLDEL